MKHLIPSLSAIAKRLLTRHRMNEADDLVQELALRLHNARGAQVQSPEAFVARVTRNVAIDQYRRERARGGGRTVSLDDAYDAPSLAYLPDQDSALLLKQVVMALPPLYRDVFILNRFMGMTYAEIAARHGLSVKAIEYRMHRALALCEEALRD